jgi:hypothetical protein
MLTESYFTSDRLFPLVSRHSQSETRLTLCLYGEQNHAHATFVRPLSELHLTRFPQGNRGPKDCSHNQEAAIARQQKQIEALTAGLKKVSAQVAASQPAKQVVLKNR